VGDPCSRVSGRRELFIALVVWCVYAHCGHFKTMYVKEKVRRWTGGWLTRTHAPLRLADVVVVDVGALSRENAMNMTLFFATELGEGDGGTARV